LAGMFLKTTLCLLCLMPIYSMAQDSIALHDRFAITPFFGLDRLTPNDNRGVHLPATIGRQRSHQHIRPYTGVYSNFPQWHFSLFGGLATQTKLADGYMMHFNLIGEDRAGSYGVLKADNIVLFTQIKATIDDTIRWGKQQLQVKLRIGDMPNFRHRNGLSIYNVDIQGAVVALRYKRWSYRFTSITDLSQHVGIGVQEVFGNDFVLNDIPLGNKYGLDVGAGWDYIPVGFGATLPVIPHIQVSARHKNRDLQFYSEIGCRMQPESSFLGIRIPSPPLRQKLAGVIGLRIQNQTSGRWRYRQQLALKYYGKIYNDDRYSVSERYASSANTFTGEYLYPLRNAYRPFDQWAVYTEYYTTNVAAVSWQSQNKYAINSKFNLMANVEAVGILAGRLDPFLYFFYECGLTYEPVKGLEAMVYLSNKVMNLDVHYQTFYQARRPLFSYGLRKRLTGYL